MRRLTAKVEVRCEDMLKTVVLRIAQKRSMTISQLTRERWLADQEISAALDAERKGRDDARASRSKRGAKQ